MLDEDLRRGLEALALQLTPLQQQQLLDYVDLLAHWNKAYNLTAVRDKRAMLTRHVLDSLAVLPMLDRARCIDVGTGAGLPGIPLAIAAPERHFSLLDSNGKKTRFLVHVGASLKLQNIEIVKARAQDYRPQERFGLVLSRAFASLGDMIESCRHLLDTDGEFLAMKGQRPEAELASLRNRATLVAFSEIAVPGLTEDRCLVRLRALQ